MELSGGGAESDRRREEPGGTCGRKARLTMCLECQREVTVATSKKSLASIYAKAGSGVFNYVNCCFSSLR